MTNYKDLCKAIAADKTRTAPPERYDAHCRITGCKCDHVICYQGWRDVEHEHSTTPCQYCRADTWERWWKREEARAKNYPNESLGRIMRGENAPGTYDPTTKGRRRAKP